MKKRLIAYFSRADENYFDGELKYIKKGNTEVAAELLQKITKADLLKIEMKTPYSEDYKECVAQAKADLDQNARPELVNLPESLKDYTIVYLGYPNYCGTTPMPVLSFLEQYDLSGIKIRPFCTQEGSGLGRSENDIFASAPGAILEVGCAIKGSDAANCEELLRQWVGYFYGMDRYEEK